MTLVSASFNQTAAVMSSNAKGLGAYIAKGFWALLAIEWSPYLGWEVSEFEDGKGAAPDAFLSQFSRVAALPACVANTPLVWPLAIFQRAMCLLNISGLFWV